MLARWRRAGLVVPTLMTIVMLPVLIALGTWQLHRKAWKEDLIARLAAARTAPPISLQEVAKRYEAGDNIEFTRVTATGTWQAVGERHLYDPRPQSQGWEIFALLQTPDGQVYVNRGWAPDKFKDPATRPAQGGPVTITGLARVAEPRGAFTPADDAKGNRWYHRDAIEFFWNGMPAEERRKLEASSTFHPPASFTIDAEPDPSEPQGWPKAEATEIRVANRHLEYVVTWWGLAATLVVVFALFARKKLRETPP